MRDIKKIALIGTDMSFSVSRDQGAYEWAGTGLGAVFAQTKNLFSPDQWRMVWDILWFNAHAIDLLRDPENKESIGDYLKRNRYSESFKDNYLLVSLDLVIKMHF